MDAVSAEKHAAEGDTAHKAKDYRAAIRHYTSALDSNPSSASYRTRRARALLAVGEGMGFVHEGRVAKGFSELKDAIEDTNHAMVLDQTSIKPYICKSQAQFLLEQYTQAIITAQKGLALNPDEERLKDIIKSSEQKQEKEKSSQFLASVSSINNPNTPIKSDPIEPDAAYDEEFERSKLRAGAPHPSSLPPGMSPGMMMSMMMSSPLDSRQDMKGSVHMDDIISEDVHKAFDIAASCYLMRPADHEGRRARATEALACSPLCPDAYNVLAEVADSLDEAIAFYRQGVEAGPKAVPPSLWSRFQGRIFASHALRGLFRCYVGLGNALRKARKYEEALSIFNELLRMDKDPNLMISSYVNFRACIVDCYLSLKNYKACRTFILNNENSLQMTSAMTTWRYTNLLLDFALKGKTEDINFGVAMGCSLDVPAFLFGDRKLPNSVDPFLMGNNKTITNILSYVRYHKKHWHNVPGAVDWLRGKFLYGMFLELNQNTQTNTRPKIDNALKAIAYTTTVKKIYEKRPITPLHLACCQNINDLIQFWINQGIPVDLQTTDGLAPIHQACYNGNLGAVKILLRNRAKQRIFDEQGMAPIHMAANQGEADIIAELVKADPSVVNLPMLVKGGGGETPLVAALHSSVYLCMTKGKKCWRCKHGCSSPHGSGCDLPRVVEVLVEAGADVNMLHQGETVLMLALQSEIFPSLRYLVTKVSSETLHRKDSKGYTALDHATMMKNPLAVKILKEAGVKNTIIGGGGGGPKSATTSATTTKKGDKSAVAAATIATKGEFAPSCHFCSKVGGVAGAGGTSLSWCSRCKDVRYCSAECQRADWKSHKQFCKPK